jgi:glycosyltransferase involved in cell wall biosynthesis
MATSNGSFSGARLSRIKFSIITPSFNQAQFIDRAVLSVLNQRGDFDLEYRVLDGGSTDGTLAILRRYESQLAWTSEPDNGQVDAINKGLKAATGDLVGWLNSDDIFLPGALQKVVTVFSEHPEIEWVHGCCEIIAQNGRPIRRWVSAYKNFRARRHSFEHLLTENYVSQMTTFWRRRVHDEIGYLDASLRYAFDYDFWLRLARRGAPIFLDDRIACFRWYATSKSGSNFEAQFREDEMVSARHAAACQRSIMIRKKFRNAAIVAIYRLLATARALGGRQS